MLQEYNELIILQCPLKKAMNHQEMYSKAVTWNDKYKFMIVRIGCLSEKPLYDKFKISIISKSLLCTEPIIKTTKFHHTIKVEFIS